MKRCLLLLLAICNLFCISAHTFPAQSKHVRIKGQVYLWTLDNAHQANPNMGDFDAIPGGYYQPAPDLYVQAEFGWLNFDIPTYTDDNGYYYISKLNPWWGKYAVNIEVRAQAMLDDSNPANPNTVSAFPAGTDLKLFYEGRTNVFPYNGETDSVRVGPGETAVMNVYIGGPGMEGGYSITEWWDASPGDNLIGFYSVETIRDAYRWAVDHAIPADDIVRSTSFMYPVGDRAHYAPFTPPAGVGHIEMNSKKLFPDEVAVPASMGQNWREYRSTLTHEYGHKIMHDVYTVLPMDFQEPKCTGHGISMTITGECGLMEGWAEFFAAAVLGYPTTNGSLEGSNIEHTYHPHPDWVSGTFTWREQVADGNQDICEGENAAVLWDIFDPQGWEYILPAHQDQAAALPSPWPVPMRWFDRLHDGDLNDTWTILREDDPDRLTDENSLTGYLNDGFWKYWRERFSSDGDKIHGLKAVLYNREISTEPLTETAPQIEILSVDPALRTARIRITEADEEDRPYIYYNLAYRRDAASRVRMLHYTDQMVSDLGSAWQGDSLTADITIPPAVSASELVFMVHDSMIPAFARYELTMDEQDAGAETGWEELSLEDRGLLPGLFAGGRMVERNGVLYVAAESRGLRIYDLQGDPENPQEIGAFDPAGFFPWGIDLEGDEAYLVDSNQVYRVDVSNPASPRLLSTLAFDPAADVKTLGIDFAGGWVYATAGWQGLYVIQPNADGSMSFAGGYQSEDCTVASDVVIYETTAYLVCEYTGLQILDLSGDPTTPALAGTWQIEAPSQHNNGRRLYEDIVLDAVNQRLYLAITWDGVYVLDISSPHQPVVQAIIQPAGAVVGLSVSEEVIYTVEGWPQGMTAIHIQDINEPYALAYLERRSAGVNILVAGEYAYIGHSNGTLSLVKIERP